MKETHILQSLGNCESRSNSPSKTRKRTKWLFFSVGTHFVVETKRKTTKCEGPNPCVDHPNGDIMVNNARCLGEPLPVQNGIDELLQKLFDKHGGEAAGSNMFFSEGDEDKEKDGTGRRALGGKHQLCFGEFTGVKSILGRFYITVLLWTFNTSFWMKGKQGEGQGPGRGGGGVGQSYVFFGRTQDLLLAIFVDPELDWCHVRGRDGHPFVPFLDARQGVHRLHSFNSCCTI